jgi:hypothetical protein
VAEADAAGADADGAADAEAAAEGFADEVAGADADGEGDGFADEPQEARANTMTTASRIGISFFIFYHPYLNVFISESMQRPEARGCRRNLVRIVTLDVVFRNNKKPFCK